MVTTNDASLAECLRLLRNHGQKQRYCHVAVGYNLRMTEMQGALGLVQIEKLEQLTQRRIANAAFLTESLGGIVQTPISRRGYRHVFHQYTIRVPRERDEWVRGLRDRGIGTAIHYPLAIHQQPFYRDQCGKFRCVAACESTNAAYATGNMAAIRNMGSLPVTEMAAEQVLSLPIHPALSREDLTMIVRGVRALCD